MHDPQANPELEQHEVTEVLSFLRRYGKLIGAGVLAAAITAIASRAYVQHKITVQAEAEQMLREAKTADEIADVVKEYGSTPVAPVALLSLAQTVFNEGDSAKAAEYYNTFLKKYKKSELRPTAELGLAFCTEADGNSQAAAEQFRTFAANHADSYLLPEAVLGLARNLKAIGQTDDARIALEDFLTEHPESAFAKNVESELKQLDQ